MQSSDSHRLELRRDNDRTHLATGSEWTVEGVRRLCTPTRSGGEDLGQIHDTAGVLVRLMQNAYQGFDIVLPPFID